MSSGVCIWDWETEMTEKLTPPLEWNHPLDTVNVDKVLVRCVNPGPRDHHDTYIYRNQRLHKSTQK